MPTSGLFAFGAGVATRLIFSLTSTVLFVPRSGVTVALRRFLFASPLLGLLEALLLWRARAGALAAIAGALFYALALALFGWAAAAHGSHRPSPIFSDDPPEVLVTRGPYRFVRHPFYAAYLASFAGSVVVTRGSFGCLALFVVHALVYARAARDEEASFLASPLGPAYAAYRERTGRFLPRLRRPRRIAHNSQPDPSSR